MAVLSLSLWSATPTTQISSPAPAPGQVYQIVQKSAEANQANWKAVIDYDYLECDRQADGTTKTYQELMLMGSRYERLVAINGQALSPEQERMEQQRYQATVLERRRESQSARSRRLLRYENTRKRDYDLLEQLTLAFDFTYLGDQLLDDREVYVLKATPRKGYRPPNLETQVLLGMEGQLWIDKTTFNWVKVEAHVVRPVSIVGFLAQVQPGTNFELEMMPVSDGIWLPKHFAMQARAKVVFFFSHNSQEDESYSDYRNSPGC
jgi:hypothetical protein